MITESMHVLAVPDLAASSRFNKDILGFEIIEIGDPGWRLYVKGVCRIMAGECPDAIPPRDLGDHSYFAYLVVDDAEAYFENAKIINVEIIKELTSEPWELNEFGLRTIDGHRIMIGNRKSKGKNAEF